MRRSYDEDGFQGRVCGRDKVRTKRGSERGMQRIEGDDTGHAQGKRVQGKERRVEANRQGIVVWETIQDKLKTQDNSGNTP